MRITEWSHGEEWWCCGDFFVRFCLDSLHMAARTGCEEVNVYCLYGAQFSGAGVCLTFVRVWEGMSSGRTV